MVIDLVLPIGVYPRPKHPGRRVSRRSREDPFFFGSDHDDPGTQAVTGDENLDYIAKRTHTDRYI